MKLKKQMALLAGASILSIGFAAAAPAQSSTAQSTPSTAKKTASTTKTKRRSAVTIDPALLHPATLNAKAPDTYEVKFTTTKGDFTVKVTRAWSPLGADRFYNLCKHHFYDGASLFRVVTGFVVQFGLSAHPQVSKAWTNATIKDEPTVQGNKPGFLTYAKGGPNSRTTQVFINLGDNKFLDSQGFPAFGEITSGMDVVAKFYSGYADQPTDKQGEIADKGKAYLDASYPKLDSIVTTTLIGGPAAPATHHTHHTPAHSSTTPKP